MKVKPLYDRILVKRSDAQAVSQGGIILPESAKEKPKQGTVVASGKGKLDEKGARIPMTVKKGDTILFSSYAGTDIKIDDVDYLIMREDDVLGIVE